MRVKYSPNARERLLQIKKNSGANIVGKITKGIRNLCDNPRQCPSTENMLGITSPYRFLHIEHNYAFYRVNGDTLYVAEIYNEREDFMGKMFGISLRTQESIDYWGE